MLLFLNLLSASTSRYLLTSPGDGSGLHTTRITGHSSNHLVLFLSSPVFVPFLLLGVLFALCFLFNCYPCSLFNSFSAFSMNPYLIIQSSPSHLSPYHSQQGYTLLAPSCPVLHGQDVWTGLSLD